MKIQIDDNDSCIGMAIADDEFNNISWNDMGIKDREQVCYLLSKALVFFQTHLYDGHAPTLEEQKQKIKERYETDTTKL